MVLKNRSEIVFLYDVRDSNPNGDPDENKPRVDEETGVNIVTDVRLKRTIRDYFQNFKKKRVWVAEEFKEGMRKTREDKLEDLWKEFKIENREQGKETLLKEFIDLRLFGATIAGKKEKTKGEKVFTWIGPVQFNFGHSLHKVEPALVKGTSILPTEAQKAGGAFTEAWVVPYSLICFYGIVNENAAVDTGLTEEDVSYLIEGMWNGTKNLVTRSKFGQIPRFLMRVVYNEGNFHIGDLDKGLVLLDKEGKIVDKDGRDGNEIRHITDVIIDINNLVEVLKNKADRIERIQIEVNDDVEFKLAENTIKGKGLKDSLEEVQELKGKVEFLNIEK